MKFITTITLFLITTSSYGQFLNWNKEETPGHKLFLHGEVDFEIFLASFGLIAEYTSKNALDDKMINYSIGFKAKRSFASLDHVTAVDFESYYGPQVGLQIGRNRHLLESTVGYGFQHINKIRNRASESQWIYNYRIGYRNQGSKILYRIGLMFSAYDEGRYGIYMSFGNRLF